MGRAIWWDNARHLVPMLDLVNAVGHESATPSRTAMRNKKATQVAPWTLNPGDEVLEDYGNPTNVYFLYHGFSLSYNRFDCLLHPREGRMADRMSPMCFKPGSWSEKIKPDVLLASVVEREIPEGASDAVREYLETENGLVRRLRYEAEQML